MAKKYPSIGDDGFHVTTFIIPTVEVRYLVVMHPIIALEPRGKFSIRLVAASTIGNIPFPAISRFT